MSFVQAMNGFGVAAGLAAGGAAGVGVAAVATPSNEQYVQNRDVDARQREQQELRSGLQAQLDALPATADVTERRRLQLRIRESETTEKNLGGEHRTNWTIAAAIGGPVASLGTAAMTYRSNFDNQLSYVRKPPTDYGWMGSWGGGTEVVRDTSIAPLRKFAPSALIGLGIGLGAATIGTGIVLANQRSQ